MSFYNPRVLWFIIIFLAFVPALIVRHKKGRERAALFAAAAPPDEREFFLRELQSRMIASDIFFLLFLVFLVIALAGPRWGTRVVADHRRGIDIVLAFDLSRSMNVRDCPPLPESRNSPGEDGGVSRLERGAAIARDFSAAPEEIRLGAAIGKGRGITAVPLTYDSGVIGTFLYSLNSEAVTGSGTNLESLLGAAAESFRDSVPSRRLIVLFSDGETLSGSLDAAAEKIRKENIILNTVGLGSADGGTVPVEKGPDAPGGFLLEAGGIPVISSLKAGPLRNGAEKTGGVYIDGNRNDAAAKLGEFVNSLSSETRLSGHRREANPRWQIFVFAAMACLAGSRLMGFHRRNRKRRRALKSVIAGGIFCLVFFGSCAKTQGMLHIMEGNFFNARGFYTEAIFSYLRALDYEDMAPYAEYGLGAAYFSLEEGDAALERYRTAGEKLPETGEHSELGYRLRYNSGIIFFEQGEYEKAAEAFREALKIDGGRIEAKRNLELSLLTIARANSPQTTSPENGTEGGRGNRGGGGSILFEYLEEKEREQWKSREWSGESDSSGPDY